MSIRKVLGMRNAITNASKYWEAPKKYPNAISRTRPLIREMNMPTEEAKAARLNVEVAGSCAALTAARYAIYETLSWRYDFYAQSQDRIHRIGQDRPVTYIRLIAADTIEEVITEALKRKASLARALLVIVHLDVVHRNRRHRSFSSQDYRKA